MRHNQLHSVAHSFADSLSSGLGFVVGHCPTDIFSDAAVNEETGIVVDFLTGSVFAKHISEELRRGLPLYRNNFHSFCDQHGVDSADYRMFRARFVAGRFGNRCIVTIEDPTGKCSSREYKENSGRRVKQIDHLGRTRPMGLARLDAETLNCDAPGN